MRASSEIQPSKGINLKLLGLFHLYQALSSYPPPPLPPSPRPPFQPPPRSAPGWEGGGV